MVWSVPKQRATIFASTNSISFKNQGGMDFLVLQLDKKGRNQCMQLNIKNVTSTLKFKSSTAKFSDKISGLSFTDITGAGASDVSTVGMVNDENVQKVSK